MTLLSNTMLTTQYDFPYKHNAKRKGRKCSLLRSKSGPQFTRLTYIHNSKTC